jgi:hypothetical protein
MNVEVRTDRWTVAFLCWALTAAAAPAGAASAGAGGEILPGKGVGAITLGMTVSNLFSLWGQPARTERDPDGVVLYDYGESRGVGVFVAGDRVSQILVVSPDWSTPNGLKVGATRPEVAAFFGRPDAQLPGQSQDEFRYLYRRAGLVLIIKGRNLAAITVIPAEAPDAPKGLDPDDPALRKPFLPTPTPPRY